MTLKKLLCKKMKNKYRSKLNLFSLHGWIKIDSKDFFNVENLNNFLIKYTAPWAKLLNINIFISTFQLNSLVL